MRLYYSNKTMEELVALLDESCGPCKREGIWIYCKKHRALHADAAEAIVLRMIDKRKAAGDNPVVDGYSGRQTRRRR